MTVCSGSSADRSRRPWPVRAAAALALVVAALASAGCLGASGDSASNTPKPTARADEAMRNTIKAALGRTGHPAEADMVTRGGARLTPLSTPFLSDWKIIQVDYRQGPHPERFHVAVGGTDARLLTGDPKTFNQVTAADPAKVTDAGGATALARTYLETTRPARRLTYVVSSVDEIKFRPNITGADAERRDRIVARYRPVVAAPAATAEDGSYAVVAYVVQDQALQRRDLGVSADGEVREKIKTLAPDLPVPYVV